MADDETPRLRVLIANATRERLQLLREVVAGLGHEVIVCDLAGDVGAATAREHPDVALVGLGSHPDQALEQISQIVRDASCPVIALVSGDDTDFIDEAATRGVFAYIVEGAAAEEFQRTLAITLRRFAEYHALQGAFGRRATIEQAKGVLMERHGIDPNRAFELLREHSRSSDRKLIDIAEAIVQSHVLLLPASPRDAESR